jgi:Protein of unknown function (DUF3025)
MALSHRVAWDPQFAQRNHWLWPLARAAAELAPFSDWPSLEQLDALYGAIAMRRAGEPLRFALDVRTRRRAAEVPAEERYDGRIALRGEVPTRPRHWHDLLNALCFATWPRSKRALHARQFGAHARRPPELRAGVRTAEQDALTLFDEGGVVIAVHASAASELRAALVRADDAAVSALEHAGRARVAPFGHALFEHMVEELPCPGASARAIALDVLPEDPELLLDALDAALSRELADATRFLAPAESMHLRLPVRASVEKMSARSVVRSR